MYNNRNKYKALFESLSIYRGLLEDPVIGKLYKLAEGMASDNGFFECLSLYNDFYYELMEKNQGYSLKDYIIKSILFSENVYGRIAQRDDFNDINREILRAVKNDLNTLKLIADFTYSDVQKLFKDENASYEFSCWNTALRVRSGNVYQWMLDKFFEYDRWGELVEELATFHKENGCGIFSRYRGFVWEENKLQGVISLDPVRLKDLVKYDRQKKIVVDNTLAFINGHPANNVLLYGSRGTGKSSTVKALLNEYYTRGLRIIEIPKPYLNTFPRLIRKIKELPQKFILFIDDLAFEDSEETYTALKAVLEGGLESRPQNVIIYATSNRRHLIKEKFSDREGMSNGGDDEVHAYDSMQEKLSLADRFGITVTFSAPNQREYLEIVGELVKERNIDIPKEELDRKAIQWEMSYNGRSPRTAKQFVDWLQGQKESEKEQQ
ncbi:MAG: ATP-binding protein [Clostridiaceae bacterium]